jgi:nicotinate-nucleotide adenylyltransferase
MRQVARRVGIFGGSFDPPHVGHLLVAVDALERLGLDRMVLVPTAQQPLKVAQGGSRASAEERLAMTRLMADGDPRFEVDPIEIERGGISYTVDTLEALTGRWPGAELVLLAGADVLGTFHRWREPERIRALATLIVLTRDERAEGDRSAPSAPPTAELPGGPPELLATRRVDVSSTEIRARLRSGKSIRGFVPEAVADFIRSAGLYR